MINLDDYPELSLLNDGDPLKQMQRTVKNNQDLMCQNQAIHQVIIEKAREETLEYNDMACRATIAHAAMNAIKNHSLLELDSLSRAILIAECQACHADYQDKSEQEQLEIQKQVGLGLKIPHMGDKIYDFKNPEELFPFAKGKDFITFSDNHRDLGNNLKKLEENINEIFIETSGAKVAVSTFIKFWQSVKQVFNSIWQTFIHHFIGESADALLNGMQLAENLDNVVEQRPLSQNARLIHQFNSQSSPLIAVMYDKTLPEIKKLELFNILVNAEKYNQNHKNIELPANAPNSSYSFEGPPLLHAVKLGNNNMILSLLKNGANPNGRGYCIGIKNLGYQGLTPLHIAVAENNLEAARLLVEHGADINALNDEGQTPLHGASSKEMADYLISQRAEVNHQDKKGNSPLHWAAKYNHLPVLESLLFVEDIIIDAKNHQGSTPLSMAAFYGISAAEHSYHFYAGQRNNHNNRLSQDNLDCLTHLIKAGSDVNHQNSEGYSPLLLAILMGEDCMGDNSKTQDPDYDFMRKKIALLCTHAADANKASFGRPEWDFSMTPLQALYKHNSFDKGKTGAKKGHC